MGGNYALHITADAWRPAVRLRAWPSAAPRHGRQYARAMFVIELTYRAPLAEIDAHMAAHVKFLNKYYAAGNLLISGRKIPRDGGIIIAVARNRQDVEAIVREDPFITRGLADVRIIEFRASQRADDIQKRIDP
jgi:uncharacterized protein YciI